MVIKRPTATAATRRIALEVHENAIFLASDGNQNTTHKHTNLVFDVKKTGDLSKKKKKCCLRNWMAHRNYFVGFVLIRSEVRSCQRGIGWQKDPGAPTGPRRELITPTLSAVYLVTNHSSLLFARRSSWRGAAPATSALMAFSGQCFLFSCSYLVVLLFVSVGISIKYALHMLNRRVSEVFRVFWKSTKLTESLITDD